MRGQAHRLPRHMGTPTMFSVSSERRFWRQFNSTRVRSTKTFVVLHLLVTLAYIRTAQDGHTRLVGLAGAVLPLLYWLPWLTEAERVAWRVPVVLVIRTTLMYVTAHALETDWDAARYPFPLVAFKVLANARVFAYFCAALGLQLPGLLDIPLQLGGVAALMATAIPRQCGMLRGVMSGPEAAGSAPRLFQLNQAAFQGFSDLLDWPFTSVLTPDGPGTFELSQHGLCTAVHGWLQLVFAFMVPEAMLLAAERRERRRFHLASRHEGGVQAEQGPAGLKQAEYASWVYLPFAAQAAWLLIRTACQLAL